MYHRDPLRQQTPGDYNPVQMASFAGSVCLITGASGGIGAALTRELARQDAVIVMVARRKDRLIALKDELSRTCAQLTATFYPIDITNAPEVEKIVTPTYREGYKL